MKIVVTANGSGLDALASPIFGRCPFFVFVDTETMEAESFDNAAISSSGGAGIQAAQFISAQGAQAVITGNVGPNAFGVLQAAQVPVYPFNGGTVQQAVEAFKRGKLQAVSAATSGPGHTGGMGSGRGRGR